METNLLETNPPFGPTPAEAVLGPDSMPQPRYYVEKKKESINHRWFYILALHLAGRTAEEISELVDRHPLTIYAILKKPEVIAVRQQLLAGISDEFEALYQEVVQTIRDCLKSDKETVRLDAAEKWFKAHGKYQPKQDKESELTAEDVVKKILQLNIQVNVGEKDAR